MSDGWEPDSRTGAWLVLQRDQHKRETHGRMVPLTASGFRVICRDREEAAKVVMLAGSISYPHPNRGVMNDRQGRYLRWLLTNYYDLMPRYDVTGRREMTVDEWLARWKPTPDQLLRGDASPVITHHCLSARGVRSEAGEMISKLLGSQMPASAR